jgi:hypothetical protein
MEPPTVKLVPTAFGIEVLCSECNEKLDRVPNETVAYNRAGEYQAHFDSHQSVKAGRVRVCESSPRHHQHDEEQDCGK